MQGGDEFDKGYAHFAVIDLHHPNCYWLLEDYDGCLTETPIKRPQPKVLDADGVEIKVGDTVYEVKTGYESKVTSTTMIDSDGNTVCCVDGCPGCLHYKPEELTHKEPDSLEKVRGELAELFTATDCADLCTCDAEDMADGFISRIEAIVRAELEGGE